ncbi:hypothetical protein [Halarchaeum sp. P4]|uniref:hypothetical protein n=1 Tax=Halarchaeum sp. P4 TaxID=3421639 RepID=UPI003EB9FE49
MVADDRVVSRIRDDGRGAVRTIAEYDRDDYEVLYVREDVEPRIDAIADQVHEELIIQELGRAHLEQMFGAGDLHCSMHRFDEVTAFHYIQDGFSGLFVSVDSDADLPLASFADTCRQQLEQLD